MAKSIVKKTNIPTQEYTCIKCKQIKKENKFYKCEDGLIVPYCKDCVKDMALDKNGLFSRESVKECCKVINKPFYYKKFDEIELKPIEEYDKINQFFKFSLRQRGKTFADSDILNVDYDYDNSNLIIDELDSDKAQKIKKLNKKQLVRKWGTEVPDDIAFLEEEFSDWKNSGAPVDTKSSRELVEQICLNKLTLRKKQKLDQPVEKELKALQELMGNANLKPMQEAINQSDEGICMGAFIKHIEKERPILPLEEPDWADELGTWIVGQLLKMENMSGEACEKYDKILEEYSINLDDALLDKEDE